MCFYCRAKAHRGPCSHHTPRLASLILQQQRARTRGRELVTGPVALAIRPLLVHHQYDDYLGSHIITAQNVDACAYFGSGPVCGITIAFGNSVKSRRHSACPTHGSSGRSRSSSGGISGVIWAALCRFCSNAGDGKPRNAAQKRAVQTRAGELSRSSSSAGRSQWLDRPAADGRSTFEECSGCTATGES